MHALCWFSGWALLQLTLLWFRIFDPPHLAWLYLHLFFSVSLETNEATWYEQSMGDTGRGIHNTRGSDQYKFSDSRVRILIYQCCQLQLSNYETFGKVRFNEFRWKLLATLNCNWIDNSSDSKAYKNLLMSKTWSVTFFTK